MVPSCRKPYTKADDRCLATDSGGCQYCDWNWSRDALPGAGPGVAGCGRSGGVRHGGSDLRDPEAARSRGVRSRFRFVRGREQKAEWIVVDGYHFAADYQRALKAAGFKILFLDDYGHSQHYSADL